MKLFVALALLILPCFAQAFETIQIRLNAEFWSRSNSEISRLGEVTPISFDLVAPSRGAGEFDFKKSTISASPLRATVTAILLTKEAPHTVVVQTRLLRENGLPLAECSQLQTVASESVYGVGACTGFDQGVQYGLTLSRQTIPSPTSER
jgi:hypothetical protein